LENNILYLNIISMDATDPILMKINEAKNNFYVSNTKNTFLKNNQKFHCATQVMSQIDETEVFKRVFPTNCNQFMFNYALFKTVAHPNIYERMGEHMFQTAKQLIAQYGTYDLIFDCAGITVSGIERYKNFVSMVANLGLQRGENLLKSMNKIYVHNPPSFLNYGLQILIPLVDPSLSEKIVIIPKSI
jgi:hypothetical protein